MPTPAAPLEPRQPASPPFLAIPHPRYKRSFIQAARELIAEGNWRQWDPLLLHTRFDEYLATLRAAETEPLAGMVPASRFWLIVDGGRFAGELDLRHRLNDSLRRFGGHIGYTIRPSARHQGYGKLLCRLGIKEARRRGIRDILLTCDADNIASRKIIEANGGVLHDSIDNGRGALTRRYWIQRGS